MDRSGTKLWMTFGSNESMACLDLVTLTIICDIRRCPSFSSMSDMHVINNHLVLSNGYKLFMLDDSPPPSEKPVGFSKSHWSIFDTCQHTGSVYHNVSDEGTVDWIQIKDRKFITQTPNNKNIITFIHGGDLAVINMAFVTQDHIDAMPKQHKQQHPFEFDDILSMISVVYLPFIRRFVILALLGDEDDDDNDKKNRILMIMYKVPSTTKAKPVKPLVFEYAKVVQVGRWNKIELLNNGRLVVVNDVQIDMYDLSSLLLSEI